MLTIVLAYFNYKDVEATLSSLENTDIIILENPSKYSEQMSNVVKKFPEVIHHFIAKENNDMEIAHYFLNNYSSLLEKYKYIAITEGDVILEKGALEEAIFLLDKYAHVGNVSIDLSLENLTIPPLPPSAVNWVPRGSDCGDHIFGDTGFQFILFRKEHLFDFISEINNKTISAPIALGINDFTGISDTNLGIFNRRKKTPWIRTKYHKLLHIGWEHYKDPNDEYWLLKTESLNTGKIRVNVDLNNIKLIKLF